MYIRKPVISSFASIKEIWIVFLFSLEITFTFAKPFMRFFYSKAGAAYLLPKPEKESCSTSHKYLWFHYLVVKEVPQLNQNLYYKRETLK